MSKNEFKPSQKCAILSNTRLNSILSLFGQVTPFFIFIHLPWERSNVYKTNETTTEKHNGKTFTMYERHKAWMKSSSSCFPAKTRFKVTITCVCAVSIWQQVQYFRCYSDPVRTNMSSEELIGKMKIILLKWGYSGIWDRIIWRASTNVSETSDTSIFCFYLKTGVAAYSKTLMSSY
jgi:hypothetical protein